MRARADRRPQLLAAGLLAAALWAIRAGRPAYSSPSVTAETRRGASDAPAAIGPWRGAPLAVEDRVVDILETDDVALMEYRRKPNEPPVWLARVAGFGNRAAFHPPELCYVGSHFEVLERGPVTVEINGSPRRLMRLIIGQEGKRYEAWYWFTAGIRVTPNYYQQQWWLMRDAVRGQRSTGTLVRISTPVDHAPQVSFDRLLRFVGEWDRAQAAGARHGA